MLHPTPVEFSALTAAVLVASIGVKLWMCCFNRILGKRIASTALMAASIDSRNDCVATSAVLVAGLAEHFFGLRIDGWIGLGVAVFILYSGWDLAKGTISALLGENPDPSLRENIVDYIRSSPRVLGYHDLMVHDYGPGRQFASLHVEMDYREDPMECHEMIDDMERECLRSHGVHLVIHYDPVVTDDPALQQLKERCSQWLASRDSRLALHDFRMIQGKRHMNLVFDVALPSDLRSQRQNLRKELEDTLNSEGLMEYHVKITFDSPEQ